MGVGIVKVISVDGN